MAIHMIRVRISTTGSDIDYLINDYIPQWLTTHTAWTEKGYENKNPVLIEPVEPDDPTAHYLGNWRFTWGDNSKAVLLDNLKSYIDSYSDWAILGYHVCDHDDSGDQRTGCSWDDVIEQGSVPADINI